MPPKEISSMIAIDPMAALLPQRVYLIYLEIHHPHVPLSETIAQLSKRMTVAERKLVLAQARAFGEVAACIQEGVA